MSPSKPKGLPPLCACGCGEPVKSHTNGVWSQWRSGHHHGINVTGDSIRNLERRRKAIRDAAAAAVQRHPAAYQQSLFPDLVPDLELP